MSNTPYDDEKKDDGVMTLVHAAPSDADIIERTERLAVTDDGDHGTKRHLVSSSNRSSALSLETPPCIDDRDRWYHRTGLFLGSGGAIVQGGPVGAWLGYSIMGMTVGGMMYCLGEMMCFDPNVGGYIEMSTRYIGRDFGYLMSFNCMLQGAVGIPTELAAVAVLASFWDKNPSHGAIYIAASLVLIVACNFVGVRYYGEVEFFFACVKVLTLIGLMIFALVADVGGIPPQHKYIGGKYWREEPFNDTYLGVTPVSLARFLGFWGVLTRAAFSYSAIESLAVLAGEAHNPRRTMRMAVRTVFYRIVGIYMLSILMIGLTVSQHSPEMAGALATGAGTATASPFVVLCNQFGVRALPHIINAVVVTSALSAGNETLYAFSRFTMALGRQGWLPPSIFLSTTKQGVPWAGIIMGGLWGCLAFMTTSKGALKIFNWFSNLNALSAMLTWISVCATYTRFRRACILQGINMQGLPLRTWGQPYVSYYCITMFALVIFFNGFASFIPKFSAENFVASYITIPIVLAAYLAYKLIKRTKMIPLEEIDLSRGPAEALIGTKYDNTRNFGGV